MFVSLQTLSVSMIVHTVLVQIQDMERKNHCFNCRFGSGKVWKAADIKFVCGAPHGFASLQRFLCWDCFMKNRLCICGCETCIMKVDIVSSWYKRSMLRIANDTLFKFHHCRLTRSSLPLPLASSYPYGNSGWNAQICRSLDVALNWQQQWQKWCNQFQ